MDREKLRDIFRKYRAVGLVLLAGLLLLLLPTGKSSGQEPVGRRATIPSSTRWRRQSSAWPSCWVK